MADRDEGAVHLQVAARPIDRVAQGQMREPACQRIAFEALDRLVPHHRDLRMLQQPVLQDLLGPQFVAAVDQRHVVGIIGEVKRFLDSGVAPADHRHFLAAIEEPVTRRAGRHALAAQFLFTRNAQPFRLRARSDHQRIADIFVPAVADCAKRAAVFEIDLDDRVPQHPRADMFGLRLHLFHQPGALHHVAKAGIILDIGGDRQLSTGLEALDHDRLHHSPRAIDRGGITRRAGTDDEELGAMGSHGKSLTKVCRNVSAAIWEAGPRLSRQVAFSKRFAQCIVHTYLGFEPGVERSV